jgi:uroporphyrinogen-III decarboxylase
MYPELAQMLEFLAIDAERVATGRRRQEAIWRGQNPDRVPILLGRSASRQVPERVGPQHLRLCEHQLRAGAAVPEYFVFDHYSLREQFKDGKKMLIESLWDIVGWARTPSDAQLALRPNFGVVLVPSAFGCGYDMAEHDMPWVAHRPAREALLASDPDGIEQRGLMPRVIEFIQYARAALRGFPDVHLYMPDLQGPMNTMFLLRQQDAFVDMLTEPDCFHALMEKICDVYIRLTKRFKKELGEPLDGGYHGAMVMAGGGVRVVDDVSIMISPEHYEEFSLPYVRKCLQPFGGGWVHSCGNISHQLHFYLETPEIRGVNFGEPQYYDFQALLPRFAESGTFCYGGPVRRPGESAEDYLRRAATALPTGKPSLIFQPRVEGMDMSEGQWPEPAETLDLWERLCSEG